MNHGIKNSPTLISMVSGSHLYGLNTPASDKDFKGIFLPTRKEVILGRVPATIQLSTGTQGQKNTSSDVDREMFSLYHFVKLACEGQTCALEMLWTPANLWEPQEYSWQVALWAEMRLERERFLSKNMKAFVGYARAQAAKYSLKGDRLNKVEAFHAVCSDFQYHNANGFLEPLSKVWDQLSWDDLRTNPQDIEECQIAGKWFGQTTQIGTVVDSLERIIARYGKRARLAADAGGSDWKALSHALRVSLQCEDLMLYKKLRLPHPIARRQYLLKIKLGEISMEEVSDEIDQSLARVESFAKSSGLPEKVDGNWWDDWLVAKIEQYVLDLPC